MDQTSFVMVVLLAGQHGVLERSPSRKKRGRRGDQMEVLKSEGLSIEAAKAKSLVTI